MNINQLKMLEKVRNGLDSDANLTSGEKCITRFLWVNGYIDAVPVEGSDAVQDALSITEKGLAALGLQEIGPVPFLVVTNPYAVAEVKSAVKWESMRIPRPPIVEHKLAFGEGVKFADAEVAGFFNSMADDATMRADLLAREIEKNTPPPEPDYIYTLHFPKAEE